MSIYIYIYMATFQKPWMAPPPTRDTQGRQKNTQGTTKEPKGLRKDTQGQLFKTQESTILAVNRLRRLMHHHT